jgi:hypothetical protein
MQRMVELYIALFGTATRRQKQTRQLQQLTQIISCPCICPTFALVFLSLGRCVCPCTSVQLLASTLVQNLACDKNTYSNSLVNNIQIATA